MKTTSYLTLFLLIAARTDIIPQPISIFLDNWNVSVSTYIKTENNGNVPDFKHFWVTNAEEFLYFRINASPFFKIIEDNQVEQFISDDNNKSETFEYIYDNALVDPLISIDITPTDKSISRVMDLIAYPEELLNEQMQTSYEFILQELPKRILDLELGLGFPSGLNFCVEVFPLGRLSLAGCFETALLIADVSFGLRYRFPMDEIFFENVYRSWWLGPLFGLRKRLWEFEGPAEFPWQADIGGSLEYVALPNKGSGFTLGIDLGARVRLDGMQQSAPVFLRITAGWAF